MLTLVIHHDNLVLLLLEALPLRRSAFSPVNTHQAATSYRLRAAVGQLRSELESRLVHGPNEGVSFGFRL